MTLNQTEALYKVNEVELVYRHRPEPETQVRINCSADAYTVFKDSWNENRIGLVEEFKILLLDNACHCLGISAICSGGLTACIADPRLIYATALKAKATRLILAHNHPSGNLTASRQDIQLTQKLLEGAKLLDIGILDHLILTPHEYLSFADIGLLSGFDVAPSFLSEENRADNRPYHKPVIQ